MCTCDLVQILVLLAFLVAPALLSAGTGHPKLYGYKIVRELPHDPKAFTQGLEFAGPCKSDPHCAGRLWESTGTHPCLVHVQQHVP